MWFGLLRRRARKASLTMRGDGRAVKGRRHAERTALGKSLQSERAKQFVYHAVNRIFEVAEELDCGIIAAENLRSFRGLIRGKQKLKKLMGLRYSWCLKHGKREEAAKLLREIRGLKRQIKLLQALPWGRFLEDLKTEAAWRGREVVPVPARGTSRTCPRCGRESKKSRVTRGGFRCVGCGFTMQADLVAALNVAKAPTKEV